MKIVAVILLVGVGAFCAFGTNEFDGKAQIEYTKSFWIQTLRSSIEATQLFKLIFSSKIFFIWNEDFCSGVLYGVPQCCSTSITSF